MPTPSRYSNCIVFLVHISKTLYCTCYQWADKVLNASLWTPKFLLLVRLLNFTILEYFWLLLEDLNDPLVYIEYGVRACELIIGT